MTYEALLVERVDGGVGIITLNRPDKLNALNYTLVCELHAVVAELDADPAIGAIVITGAGEKAFSAGADIHENVGLDPAVYEARQPQRSEFQWDLANAKKPTIGAINGLAYGGAGVLSSSLDIRIGCERSRFRFLAASYGRINCTWTLPVVVGWARAKELLYTARVVEAEEALQIGLLNKLVPSAQLMDAAVEMGRQIAANTPEMVQGIKQLLHEDIGRGWREMFDAERNALSGDLKPKPVREGFAEFLSRKGAPGAAR
jgi:enoyl-CoA hydratase